jgi:hypothetical protein
MPETAMPEPITLITLIAFGAALVLTLVLAAWLTPRHWWRRPNLRAFAVLAIGTCALGSVLLCFVPASRPAGAAAPLASIAVPAHDLPGAGVRYRVIDDLNLRAHSGIGGARIAVIRAGAMVTATGVRERDWWQVSAAVGGREVRGWASSLWLRRSDELR